MDAPNASVVATRLRLRRIRPLPDRIRARDRGLERELHIPGLGEKVKQRDVRNTVTTQEATYADSQAYDPTVKVESDGVTTNVTDNPPTVDVTGTHAACTKGTSSFSGSTSEYAWTP